MKIQKIFPFIFFVCSLSDSIGEPSVFDVFSSGEAKIFLNLAFYDRNEIIVYELYRSEDGAFFHKRKVPWHWEQQKMARIDMRYAEKTRIDFETFNNLLNTILDTEFLENVSRLTNMNLSNAFGSITVEKGGLKVSIPAVGWVMPLKYETNTESNGSHEDTPPLIEESPPPATDITDETELRIEAIVETILRLADDWGDAAEIESGSGEDLPPRPPTTGHTGP